MLVWQISQQENLRSLLAPQSSLKQILQDVNGKFEVGTAYFPKIKSSDEGGVSIGGASLWALNNNDPKASCNMGVRKIPDLSGVSGLLERTDRIFPCNCKVSGRAGI